MAKHNIVTTSKMMGTKNDALIEVTCKAKADLDNGRIATVDFAKGEVSYATSNEGELFLICTPEHTRYNGETLVEFFNPEGKKVRVMKIMQGDEFGTDAVVGGVSALQVGDKLSVQTDGQLGKDSSTGVFVVVEKKMVGYTLVADVRYNG